MASYTAQQYHAQRRIQAAIVAANAAGLCVVCNQQPQAVWPDGVRRITCGRPDCYHRWLRFRPEPTHEEAAA